MTEKALTVFNDERFEKDARLGMSKVDPMDIRPPSIMLRQKTSEPELFKDGKGKLAEVGEYFHAGRCKVLPSFECYFVFAAKSEKVNKYRAEDGPQEQYAAIGMMADDMTPFSMLFRGTARYALSPLFTATVSLHRPMYAIKVRVESREIHGEQNTWSVPVVKVQGPETDQEKLATLYELAYKLDSNADKVVAESDDDDGTDPVNF